LMSRLTDETVRFFRFAPITTKNVWFNQKLDSQLVLFCMDVYGGPVIIISVDPKERAQDSFRSFNTTVWPFLFAKQLPFKFTSKTSKCGKLFFIFTRYPIMSVYPDLLKQPKTLFDQPQETTPSIPDRDDNERGRDNATFKDPTPGIPVTIDLGLMRNSNLSPLTTTTYKHEPKQFDETETTVICETNSNPVIENPLYLRNPKFNLTNTQAGMFTRGEPAVDCFPPMPIVVNVDSKPPDHPSDDVELVDHSFDPQRPLPSRDPEPDPRTQKDPSNASHSSTNTELRNFVFEKDIEDYLDEFESKDDDPIPTPPFYPLHSEMDVEEETWGLK